MWLKIDVQVDIEQTNKHSSFVETSHIWLKIDVQVAIEQTDKKDGYQGQKWIKLLITPYRFQPMETL